jgi:hypothetical protein
VVRAIGRGVPEQPAREACSIVPEIANGAEFTVRGLMKPVFPPFGDSYPKERHRTATPAAKSLKARGEDFLRKGRVRRC